MSTPKEKEPVPTTVITSTNANLKPPIKEPMPIVQPLPTPEMDSKQHVKRTTSAPTIFTAEESVNVDSMVDKLTSFLSKKEAPTEGDLKHQEKQRKVEIINSYAWTAVQIAAALCFLALALSYLKMANIARLNTLNV